jgi:hypothetical protein
MNNPELHIKLSGDASNVLHAVQQVQQSLNNMASTAQQANAKTIAQGVALGQMFLDVGKKAFHMAQEAMGAFSSVASETRTLKRVMGGTAEDMSRLRFAGHELGISADRIATSMGIASKHFVDNDKAVRQLGVSYKDADGKVKPAIELLGEIGDRLNALKDPYGRATAARELFGRGYKEMMPLLGLGSEGIKKFAEESDKLGHTMSEKDLKAARAFKLQMKELHATFEGIYIAVGRSIIPVLTNLVHKFTELAQMVVNAWKENTTFGRVLKGVAVGLGILIAAIAAYKTYTMIAAAATKAWGVAQAIVNGIMSMNPVTLVVLAIVGLIAAIIALVKNFGVAGTVVEIFFGGLGAIVGAVASAVVIGFQVMTASVAAFAYALGKAASWIGKTFHIGWLEKAGDGVSNFVADSEKKLAAFAASAPKAGYDIGKGLGEKIVQAIKDMKIPNIGDLFKSKSGGGAAAGGSGGLPPELLPTDDKPAGGGGGAKKQADRVKAFFKALVDGARDALDAAKQAAIDAKKQMDDMAKSIGDSLRSAFSITDIADSLGGVVGGPNRLLATYRKRLADMREFVANVKRLRELGLPPEMLQDIVSAGVAKGAALAKMLVANPTAITELAGLQAAITAETTAAGAYVSDAVMGSQVAGLTDAAIASQATFNTYLGAARQGGYTPTQQDIDASTQNIHNAVYMDVATNADPATIQQAIEWALATNTPVRRGAGGGPRGGATGASPSPTRGGTGMGAGSQNWTAPTAGGGYAGWGAPGYGSTAAAPKDVVGKHWVSSGHGGFGEWVMDDDARVGVTH